MYYPDKKEFIKLSKKGSLIPVYTQILADFETPLSAFAKIDKGEYSFLLESVEGGERIARYSFLGSSPSVIFSTKGDKVTIREGKIIKTLISKDPINELRKLLVPGAGSTLAHAAPGEHRQRRQQRRGAVPLVVVRERATATGVEW